jgi:hypothetical protein
MLKRIHKLLDEADVVVTHNGIKFDLPTLNKEFLLKGFAPPSPYKQVDTLLACRKLYRFPSNKLDYVAQSLGLGNKVKHSGFDLWVKCMGGDREAWKEMEEYNRQDVILLESVYKKILPWMPNHPNRSAHDSDPCCPNCGSHSYQKRGTQLTKIQRYVRYQCKECGHWFRSTQLITSNHEAFRQVA